MCLGLFLFGTIGKGERGAKELPISPVFTFISRLVML
jgi:hypothetical protein